jgi:putative SOS response-associated peptidase YedK
VNSREDKLGGGTWGKAFLERRCLIPASAFFEWVTGPDCRALPLRFTRPGSRGILIAGIWEEDKERGECFSMITTEPSDAIRLVHDRMPAVLANEQLRPYLEGTLKEFGPSSVPLEWAVAENFLRKAADPPAQGELF